MSDFLFIQGLIAERLKVNMPDDNVFESLSESDSHGAVVGKPGIYVISAGFDVINVAQASRHARYKQTFIVSVSVLTRKKVNTGVSFRSVAGPKINRVLELLTGWKGAGMIKPLTPVSSGQEIYINGLTHYPLGFESEIIVTAVDAA